MAGVTRHGLIRVVSHNVSGGCVGRKELIKTTVVTFYHRLSTRSRRYWNDSSGQCGQPPLPVLDRALNVDCPKGKFELDLLVAVEVSGTVADVVV